MEYYLPLKHLHMLCAYLSATLFTGRLLLDMAGKTNWRQSPLRYLPHINDTLLLTLAFTLLAIGPWQPFSHQWLGFKILLLLSYIMFGFAALKQSLAVPTRTICAVLALAQLAGVFYLARFKPVLFVLS